MFRVFRGPGFLAVALALLLPSAALAAKSNKKASPAAKSSESKGTSKTAKPPAPKEEPAPEPEAADDPDAADGEEAAGEEGEADEGEAASTEADADDDFRSPAAMKANQRDTIIFLDGGFRWDLGNFSRTETVGANEQNDNQNIDQLGGIVHLGLLSRLDDSWRLGGAFGYAGNYSVGGQDGSLGQQLTLDFRVEWTGHLTGAFWLLGAPRIGVSTIIPAGILQDRIDQNQRFGFNTLSGPRLGFLIGGDVGVRYMVNNWFSLRGTVGYVYNMHFLINSTASGELVDASQSWTVSASRLSGNLGLEVAF